MAEHQTSTRSDALRWAASFVILLIVGGGLGLAFPGAFVQNGVAPAVPPLLVVPFALLLSCVALGPLVASRAWHRHYPSIALGLGGLVAGYYLAGYRGASTHGMPWGLYAVKHAFLEYYSFLALVGGLYVVSGSIVIDLRGRGRPLFNTLILLIGAVLSNFIGTTGASVLLLRPFMRVNHGRLRPLHIIFFIFIVSNCGGCLTPIGDPPLYLGYLKGVPFFWTFEHLWQSWLEVNLPLLALFFLVDRYIEKRVNPVDVQEHKFYFGIRGKSGIFLLALMIGAVFIDPVLLPMVGLQGWPIGATVQLIIATVGYVTAPKFAHEANDFNFGPIKEVGLLFAGIFLTMIPALGYLGARGPSLGLDHPLAYYFGTGFLSAVLDNAPTYLNFLQISYGPGEMEREGIRLFLSDPANAKILEAISAGAVFFGAMTYIGNGPNFMVKAIAEHHNLRMPSFFGYLGRASVLLLPVLVVHGLNRFL